MRILNYSNISVLGLKELKEKIKYIVKVFYYYILSFSVSCLTKLMVPRPVRSEICNQVDESMVISSCDSRYAASTVDQVIILLHDQINKKSDCSDGT